MKITIEYDDPKHGAFTAFDAMLAAIGSTDGLLVTANLAGLNKVMMLARLEPERAGPQDPACGCPKYKGILIGFDDDAQTEFLFTSPDKTGVVRGART